VTPLMCCINSANYDDAPVLRVFPVLADAANVNALDTAGQTVLLATVLMGRRWGIANALLARKADVLSPKFPVR